MGITVGTPLAFAVNQLDMSHAYISWARVLEAEGYEIQRSSSSDFSSGVFTVKPAAAASNFTLSTECGKTYYFRMRAYVNADAGNIVYSEWTRVITLRTVPAPPAALTATALSSNEVRLAWSQVPGVSGYLIKRDGVQVGKKGGEANLSFTDTGLVLGQKYTYTVYSHVKLANGAEILSDKAKELEYVCVPPAPQNVRAESAGVSTIKIAWERVPGVISYEVYRAPAGGAVFRLIGTVSGANTLSFLDENRVSGETYQYYVIAVVSENVKSAKSETVTGVAKALAPTGVKATHVDSSHIRLTWNAVEDANGYIIEVSSNRDSGYTELTHGALEACTFTETGLFIGQRRYYRICAYLGAYGDANRYGAWSTVVSEATRPKAPSNLTVKNVAFNKLGLTFTSSEGAVGYEISQSTDGKNFMVANIQATTSYTSGALMVGQTYYYRVRAYTLDNDGITKLYGSYSAVKSLMVTTLAPASLTATRLNPRTNQIKLEWSPVWGATGYLIYVNQDVTGSKFLAKTTDPSTTFIAKNLHQGSSYVYWVRAYRNENGREVQGLLRKANELTLNIPVVQFTTTQAGSEARSVVVNWGTVYGVEGYHVEVEGIDDTYTYTVDTSQTSVVLKNLTLGNRYTCKVKAYGTVAGKRVYGVEGVKENISPSAPAPTTLNVYTLKTSYGLYLTWQPVPGCSGYRIQRSTQRNTGFTDLLHIEGSTNTEYYDRFTSEDAGVTYYYRVASYMEAVGQRTYSANTSVRSAIILAPMPKNVKTSANSATTITLSWDAVADADGYQIYQSNAENGTYRSIRRVSGAQTSLQISELTVGTDYFFKVRAYNEKGAVTVLGTPSTAVYGAPTFLAPTGLSGIAYPKSVKLSWNAVSGASGYKLYISWDNGVNYNEIGYTTARTFTATGLECGRTYLFKVAAYKNVGNGRIVGIASAPISKKTGLTVPTGAKAVSVNSGKVTVSWNALREVDGYEVLKAPASNGTYTSIGEVRSGTLKLENTVERSGYPYYYKVRAYVVQPNGTRWYGPLSTPFSGRALPTAPKNLIASRVWRYSIVLNWQETDRVAGYKIFYREKGTTAWTLETLVGEGITQHMLTGLDGLTTYQIIVKPICYNENGTIINGSGQTPMLTVRTK